MKIAICDDKKVSIEKLRELLENYMKQRNIENYAIVEYASGFDLLDEYSPGVFSFIFLDVDMPDLDGFETAARIRKTDLEVDIVFVTYMDQHIGVGYRYSAKEYLIKPLEQEQINVIIDRLLKERKHKKMRMRYSIKLKAGGEIDLNLDDVIYFESQGKYIRAVTTTLGEIIFRYQISSLKDDLKEEGFVSTHQSFIVNMRYIFTIVGSLVVLNEEAGGIKVPVSKAQKKSTKEACRAYRRQ